mmetsp:Transcript_19132/g.18264  ORF Transcript_19132/g.18264 Transcript_19132/m.18264 type:complete len:145 (-) Transcript_19132:517-951(-)
MCLSLQIQKLRAILQGNFNQRLSQELRRTIQKQIYDEMVTIYCQPYQLSSFFHRIFYNVDDLFIFKKQFTKYHSANSFFSYIFNQTQNFTLSQISFCKTSGRVVFGDSKLTDGLKRHTILAQYQDKLAKFEEENEFAPHHASYP